MAYPIPAIALEHCLHQFLNSWNAGFKPSLNVETYDEGTVVMSMEFASLVPNQSSTHGKMSHHTDFCKRSGKVSRARRRAIRNNSHIKDTENACCDATTQTNYDYECDHQNSNFY